MKKALTILSILLFINTLSAQIADSAVMGPGYANDVYYSFKNGKVLNESNTNWHIALRNGLQNDAILINSTAGVKGYLTNADTTQWATLDTSNKTTEVFNTDTSWEIGAFNRTFDNIYSSWGVYNTITHKVTGDSLFLLNINNQWIKLWIVEKDYGNWKVRVSNSNIDTTFYLSSANLRNKMFGYINLNTFSLVEREAIDSTWDIKFTRYAAFQPVQQVYYPSTGVLSNAGVQVVKVKNIVKETYNDFNAHTFTRNISAIGSDWKSFNNSTFQWKVEDSTVYFVKTKNGDVYKMYFTGFGGSGSGASYFNTQKLFSTGLNSTQNPLSNTTLYPNPAQQQATAIFNSNISSGNGNVAVLNINGQVLTSMPTSVQKGLNEVSLDLSNLSTGIYFVQIAVDNFISTQKLVVVK